MVQLGASMTDCFVGDWTPAAPARHFCCAEHCHAHATPFPISHHRSLLSSTTHHPQQLPLRKDWTPATHCLPRQALLSPEDKAAGKLRWPIRRTHVLPAANTATDGTVALVHLTPNAAQHPTPFFPAPHAQCRRAERSRPLTEVALTT